MKKLQLLMVCFMCLFTANIFAQQLDNQLVRQLNISIISPGVSAEIPLGEKFTIFGKLDLGFGFSIADSIEMIDEETNIDYAIIPSYTLQGRYYYKCLKSETNRGKPLFGNSGNYVFAQFAGNLPPIVKSDSFTSDRVYGFGLGWGVQRIYKSRILWSYGIGLGYESTQNLNIISEFTLGVNLNKR